MAPLPPGTALAASVGAASGGALQQEQFPRRHFRRSFLRSNFRRTNFHGSCFHGATSAEQPSGATSAVLLPREQLRWVAARGALLRGSFCGGNFRNPRSKVYLPGGGIIQRKAIEARGRQGERGAEAREAAPRESLEEQREPRLRIAVPRPWGRRVRAPAEQGPFHPSRPAPQSPAERGKSWCEVPSRAGWLGGLRGLLLDEDRLRRCCFQPFEKRWSLRRRGKRSGWRKGAGSGRLLHDQGSFLSRGTRRLGSRKRVDKFRRGSRLRGDLRLRCGVEYDTSISAGWGSGEYPGASSTAGSANATPSAMRGKIRRRVLH